MQPLAVHLTPYDETAWSTPSYFGASDTNGSHNFYVETSDFHAYLNATDNDEGARSVFRYNLFNNAGFGTHGADGSPLGQRYFEYYNNVGNYNGYGDLTTFNMNWWFFIRGGTFVIYNNQLPAIDSQDYSHNDMNMTVMNLQRNIGPNACWGAGTSGGARYHAPRQVGLGYVTGNGVAGNGQHTYSSAAYGYSSTEYVGDSEPGYVWGNSRGLTTAITDYGGSECSNPDTSQNYIVAGRDYINNGTSKPGWSPYVYPHPLVK
jgi:hypothetical protein